MNGVVIHAFSRMQRCVTLSVTEAEFVAAVEVVVNMLFAWRVVESMGLTVQLPMKIEVDNKGAVGLANSWTATNRTRPNQFSSRAQGSGHSFGRLDLQSIHVIGYIHEECRRSEHCTTSGYVREGESRVSWKGCWNDGSCHEGGLYGPRYEGSLGIVGNRKRKYPGVRT
jgi:hypothetical protein